ncbi:MULTISPECIES: ParB/RepB/Spo0J family partition protein [unclassified Treponema]|uniref:ParB/RepB/Spo0J family partition protein n=1 Tax=unclassified Treponema TaxID=2638727 RepID=UPI000E9749B6|nr:MULTISPECIES: ParB/RepB/Spo0J family partition protein [unclassified Treponema]HBP08868.1 chromosome partitioning protein ParB [Treponema sp.]
MAKHQGLGKGLGALMQEVDLSEEFSENGVQLKENAAPVNLNLPAGISSDENGTLWVDPALLKPNPRQPRTYFDDEKLAELTESVRKEGILSPVIIEDANDGTFFIIAGERRTRAAKAAGLKKIPVQLRKYSEQRKLEVALIENIQRTDLNALEEAQAYYDLMELGNLTQDQVAERVGKNRSTVANCLRLLKLPEDIQKALVTDSISSGHARAILSLENDSDKRILFGKIIGQGLSVRQSENIAKEMKGGISSAAKTDFKPEPKKDPNLAALEQKLIERLGTKVQLKGEFSKGTISINYFSSEDLDRIFNLIVPDANL